MIGLDFVLNFLQNKSKIIWSNAAFACISRAETLISNIFQGCTGAIWCEQTCLENSHGSAKE
jgi:hypothetical protein